MARHSWSKAIVTGAASGIGRCFAETLARSGCAVGLIDVAAGPLAELAARLGSDGAAVHALVADVADGEALARVVADLALALGGIDLAIHCAAIGRGGTFAEQPREEFDRVLAVNLAGTANLLRAAIPPLRLRGGTVACIASTAAVHGWPRLAAYSAAKFGVAGLCDAVRAEVASDGVHVAAVFPLLIDTPLVRDAKAAAPILRGPTLPPQAVVDKTLRGLAAGHARIYVPGTVRAIALLQAIAPSLLDWYGRRMGLA